MSEDIVLHLSNLSLEIPGLDKAILHGIDYTINYRDFVILLGSNGSGKSSLLKLIDGRYEKTAGEIIFAGRDLMQYSRSARAEQIITLTQNYEESLFGTLTVLENCLLRFHGGDAAQFFTKYLAKFNLNLASKLGEITANLSGGEKQALAFALSVLYPPKLLLLDEHTSALDPKAALNLMQLTDEVVRANGITCILTTHDLDIALNYGNKILALRDGKTHCCIDRGTRVNITKKDLVTACY